MAVGEPMTEFLLSFLLMFIGHELGHDHEASIQRVPMEWGLQSTGLVWAARTSCPDKLSRIAGSGFRAQDTVSRLASGSRLQKSIRLVSAANKIAYLLVPESIHRPIDIELPMGDLNALLQFKPGASAYFLAASALSDLYKAYRPDPAWDLGFWQADNGTPGLVFKMRF
jgi:hypothetical protein